MEKYIALYIIFGLIFTGFVRLTSKKKIRVTVLLGLFLFWPIVWSIMFLDYEI